jgi:hypothetical protein
VVVEVTRVGEDFVEATVGEGAGVRDVLLTFAALAAVQSRELER